MMNYTLTMTFLSENGEKNNLSVSGVRPDLTETEINQLMDAVVSEDVLRGSRGSFVAKYGAKLTGKEVNPFEF